MQIAVIGLDLAKNVFQVHGIDDSGQAVLKRKLRRSEVLPFFAGLAPALVGIEACHTAHAWRKTMMGFSARRRGRRRLPTRSDRVSTTYPRKKSKARACLND